ncbi:hypothetical protein HY256_00470 [Candidatus Sumerlaeota bacterium]|nr:hypothetical protein [Candidatus Sumerlaeota bacterium]
MSARTSHIRLMIRRHPVWCGLGILTVVAGVAWPTRYTFQPSQSPLNAPIVHYKLSGFDRKYLYSLPDRNMYDEVMTLSYKIMSGNYVSFYQHVVDYQGEDPEITREIAAAAAGKHISEDGQKQTDVTQLEWCAEYMAAVAHEASNTSETLRAARTILAFYGQLLENHNEFVCSGGTYDWDGGYKPVAVLELLDLYWKVLLTKLTDKELAEIGYTRFEL